MKRNPETKRYLKGSRYSPSERDILLNKPNKSRALTDLTKWITQTRTKLKKLLRAKRCYEVQYTHPSRKLTSRQVIEIKNRLRKGDYQTKLAKEFGVSQMTIWKIKHNLLWTEIGGSVD